MFMSHAPKASGLTPVVLVLSLLSLVAVLCYRPAPAQAGDAPATRPAMVPMLPGAAPAPSTPSMSAAPTTPATRPFDAEAPNEVKIFDNTPAHFAPDAASGT